MENNNIYLCLAKDVVNQEKETDDKYLLRLYFPQLYREVKSKDELLSRGARLYDSEKNKVKNITHIMIEWIILQYI